MREKDVQLSALLPLIQEKLDAGQNVTFSPRGVSMQPMLKQGRDRVTLSPVKGPLKKYDLPLYRMDSGKFILHRIVAVGDAYICRGDNTYVDEIGIRQDQLIGVVSSFTHRGKNISVQAPLYRLYCRVWVAVYPLRRFVRRGVGFLRRRLKRGEN